MFCCSVEERALEWPTKARKLRCKPPAFCLIRALQTFIFIIDSFTAAYLVPSQALIALTRRSKHPSRPGWSRGCVFSRKNMRAGGPITNYGLGRTCWYVLNRLKAGNFPLYFKMRDIWLSVEYLLSRLVAHIHQLIIHQTCPTSERTRPPKARCPILPKVWQVSGTHYENENVFACRIIWKLKIRRTIWEAPFYSVSGLSPRGISAGRYAFIVLTIIFTRNGKNLRWAPSL